MTAFCLALCLLAVSSAVGLVFMDRWRAPLRAALLCSVSSLVTLGAFHNEGGIYGRRSGFVRRFDDGDAGYGTPGCHSFTIFF